MNSKNTAKTILVLIVLLSTLFFLTQNSKSNLVSAKNDGASDYQAHCATCHGADGRAKTARGKRKGATDLTKSTIGTSEGIRVIANGRERMPGFSDTLSAERIREVMNYIRRFRR